MRLFLIQILICILSFACNTLAGHRGASEDMKESKKRKVFIAEYTVRQNPYKINDTLQITVIEAWLEKKWAYSEDPNVSIVMNGYQLRINTLEKDMKGVCFDWSIGIDRRKYIRESSDASLISDLDSIPQNNTIEYMVQKGDNFNDEEKKDILGKFV